MRVHHGIKDYALTARRDGPLARGPEPHLNPPSAPTDSDRRAAAARIVKARRRSELRKAARRRA